MDTNFSMPVGWPKPLYVSYVVMKNPTIPIAGPQIMKIPTPEITYGSVILQQVGPIVDSASVYSLTARIQNMLTVSDPVMILSFSRLETHDG